MIPGLLFFLCAAYVVWLGAVYPRIITHLAQGKTLPDGAALPPITVIVPAYNEEDHIVAKMQDLARQDYPPELVTIFVVDNGSTDRTAELADECHAIVLDSPRGKISAINTACAQCENNVVVVTDADTTLEPDALRHLVQPLADPVIGAVGGRVAVEDGDGWWSESKVRYHELDWDLRTAEGLVDTAISLDGKLMAWKLSVFAGFPKKAAVDDLLLSLKLRAMDFRAVIQPLAIVHEPGERTWRGELRQIRRRAAISMPPIFEEAGLMFYRRAGWYGRLILPTRRVFAIFLPFMLLYCWVYVLVWSWPVWLLCTIAGVGAIVWKRVYFPLLQQLGIMLAWVDFMRGNVAPAAAWERNG